MNAIDGQAAPKGATTMRSTRERPSARPPLRALAASLMLAAASLALASGFQVVAPSEANYRVREQLAGFSFPNDAVGVTTAVSGLVRFAEVGAPEPGAQVVVELESLTSDNGRRDNYVHRNLLLTNRFPTAVFVPTAVTGLPAPLPSEGTHEVLIEGQLTLLEVTRPVVWRGTATFDGDAVHLEAATTFTFEDFGLAKPRVASVLSVADEITLEIRLSLAQTED